ncbi:MAG: aminotransferase class I/II-fold pyridoxal phosphate-dependent enzyme [Salinivirgaceae bacterium]|nr:aminotransferase class I/II-fold pyridoxal phosphate-dependent enzyme [Salinivirgaceae bacterium]
MHLDFENRLQARLAQLANKGLYRNTTVADSLKFDLCNRPYFIHDNLPIGKSADFNASGLSVCKSLQRKLEQELAIFLKTSDCLVLSSNCNVVEQIANVLLDKEDALITATLETVNTKSTLHHFHQFDVDELENKLQLSQAQHCRIVAVDAVSPITGAIAPMEHICNLANSYKATVLIDETNSLGVLGENGGGVSELFGVEQQVDIKVGSLYNLLGIQASFVAGSRLIIDALRQGLCPLNFFGVSEQTAESALSALQQLKTVDLTMPIQLTNYLIRKLYHSHFEILPTQSAICAIEFDGEQTANQLSIALIEQGIATIALSYPYASKGKSYLRTKLYNAMNEQDVELVAEIVTNAAKQQKVIE